MINLLSGLRNFSEQVYPKQKDLFDTLSQGQKPHTLFITCSDSRIDPNLITQTQPGELFVIRNAGNIVPPFGSSNGGEEATIEFGIDGLGVQNIIICGHSKCGAMAALPDEVDKSALPSINSWLNHARATKKIAAEKKLDLRECIEENVLVQAQNLKTHPTVIAGLKSGKINIFGWVYHFETGTVSVYHNKHKKFIASQKLETTAEHTVSDFCI